jgi:hypothetical protein
MEESEVVLERLARIDELGRAGAPAPALLAELRGLVGDVEASARREADEGARPTRPGSDGAPLRATVRRGPIDHR